MSSSGGKISSGWRLAAVLCGGLLLLADLLTKLWVVRAFELHKSVPVIDGFFYFTHVRNTGAAWSMFSGYGWALAGLGVLMGAFIVIAFAKLSEGYPERMIALALLLAGIVGNTIDRVCYGSVVDFLDFDFGFYRYPTFNVADSGICCGVFLLVISSLLRKKSGGAGQKTPGSAEK